MGEGEVIYYHHDNLGSTRLMTDSAGEVVFDQDYLPFGGDLAVVGDLEPQNDIHESYKYTGQRQEVSIGLYYYGARFYDPDLGRFITEDSYAGELVNPQSENIYIYVMNNPMRYVDPTGHYAVKDLWHGDILWDKVLAPNSKNHIGYLKSHESFREKYTINGELVRYKLVPEINIRRISQVAMGPTSFILERNILGLVKGNSLTKIGYKYAADSSLEVLTRVGGKASEYAGPIGAVYSIANYYYEGIKMISNNNLAYVDKIAFELMNEAKIPIYGKEQSELKNRMEFVYDFMNEHKDYLLERGPNIGRMRPGNPILTHVSRYEYDTFVTQYYYNTDKKIDSSVIAARNERKGIIEKLEKGYWGYWDYFGGYDNRKFISGYRQDKEKKDIVTEK